jgi:type IV pilus assembly protein PilY1
MRSELQVQTITALTANQRAVSTTPMDWTTKKGWYEDLPTSGERLTGTPLLINGTLFYNTFIPSLSPCDFGGGGFLMAVNFKNGGQESFRVFDSNGDGKVDKNDALLGGINVGAALGGATFIAPGERGKDGVAITIATKPLGGATGGSAAAGSTIAWQVWQGKRISWRELTPQ